MDRQKNSRTTKNIESELENTFDRKEVENLQTENTLLSIDVGLDISTSIIGVVVLDSTTGTLLVKDAIKLTGVKFADCWDKAVEVEKKLLQTIDVTKYRVENIFVEEAHMKFTPGLSSAGTLFSLARFNGIASYIAYKHFDSKPKMTNVRTARKSLGIKINHKDKSSTTKAKVMSNVMKMLSHVTWPTHIAKTGKNKGKVVFDKACEDMCDAYVIARGGQLIWKTYKKSGPENLK